ncbi:LysR family transcriptional regulator [Vibrio sp. MarTm2]|uniref:LysR family transcriptional regulator n=1 Tax=Vibrio sp. MarTm2 TaxID=2998831 RepID=UPI0022CD7C29|nr:LysR family transcriptional regulator [Vibrio sp. MarTm2]MDA0127997.1 LysR family transcriptional regulator [Vibrio sp. MarTm2]
MLNQINLADIRSFVLIAQLGNFTKAAEALNVSRSHVSRQISQLEKQMGVTLLIRTTRTLKLTDAGRHFYQQCAHALGTIDQALSSATEDTETLQGVIKVNAVGGYLGEELIADLISEFMISHPNVTVSLEFSSHRVDLIEDEFDIAFRMGQLDDAGFVARKLMNVEMGTLASPSYLASSPPLEHPNQLRHHQCLTGSVTRWSFEHPSTKQVMDVNINGHLKCKNGRVLVKGALKDHGIIRVPLIYCQEELRQGALKEVFQDWRVPSVEFSMIYPKDRYQPKRLKLFISFAREYFQRQNERIKDNAAL